MKRLAPLALIAALALTGCAPKALEVAPGPSHVPAGQIVATKSGEIFVADETKSGQAWADEMVKLFLNGQGAHGFEAFNGTALGAIDSWRAGNQGQLILEVSGEGFEWSNGQPVDDENSLVEVSKTFMSTVGYEAKSLQSVKIVSSSDKEYGTYGRSDMSSANPWTS